MNPSWLSCANGGRSLALVNEATIGPLALLKDCYWFVSGWESDERGGNHKGSTSHSAMAPLQREGTPASKSSLQPEELLHQTGLGSRGPSYCNLLPGSIFNHKMCVFTAEGRGHPSQLEQLLFNFVHNWSKVFPVFYWNSRCSSQMNSLKWYKGKCWTARGLNKVSLPQDWKTMLKKRNMPESWNTSNGLQKTGRKKGSLRRRIFVGERMVPHCVKHRGWSVKRTLTTTAFCSAMTTTTKSNLRSLYILNFWFTFQHELYHLMWMIEKAFHWHSFI